MPPKPVSFREAFWYWLKLGFISFGGPAGQIAIMHQELVEKRRWISERRFLHALNFAMLLPGPEAQQLATYIGWLMHGVKGGITAGALFVLPSLFILISLTWVYLVFGNIPFVSGIFFGIKPAVTAIVLFAAYRIGSRVLKNSALWFLAAAAFIAIFVFDVPFPYIVLGAAIIGFTGTYIAPEKFAVGGSHNANKKNFGPALIDDDTDIPEHASFKWPRLIKYLIVGFILFVTPFGALIILYGWEGVLTQMAWFFTQAALLTFGGAYAVLPYVYQGGVEHYHWLTPTQMIDGLALGESTPGPLIMIVAFVGFVGAWTKAIFGADALAYAGMAGASVATFFTFLPSFLFVLIGGPIIEASHGETKLTASLTAITAAVVGVILNLAMFFAYHVFWPKGFDQPFEWFSAIIAVIAFIALWRFKVGVLKVLGACAIVGLAYTSLLL